MLFRMDDSLDELLAFTPVPLLRVRRDGWTERTQRLFIAGLSLLGGVAAAARACSMTPKSAYRLRERDGAEDFARAWDAALATGRDRAFERAVDRGLNGYTVPVYRAGRQTGVRHTFDNRLLFAVARGNDGGQRDGTDARERFAALLDEIAPRVPVTSSAQAPAKVTR